MLPNVFLKSMNIIGSFGVFSERCGFGLSQKAGWLLEDMIRYKLRREWTVNAKGPGWESFGKSCDGSKLRQQEISDMLEISAKYWLVIFQSHRKVSVSVLPSILTDYLREANVIRDGERWEKAGQKKDWVSLEEVEILANGSAALIKYAGKDIENKQPERPTVPMAQPQRIVPPVIVPQRNEAPKSLASVASAPAVGPSHV